MKKLKTYYQNAKLQFVMCIATILFIFLCMKFLFKLSLIIMCMLVVLIYLVIIILTTKYKNNKNAKSVSLIVSLLVMCITFLNIFLLADIDKMEKPVDDVKNYSKYVHSKYLLNVFPKKIPKSANDVHFVYSPGFLQGGTSYILYYKDKKADLDLFDKSYRKKAIWIGYSSEIDNENIFKENEVNKLIDDNFLGTPIENNDFKIYLFDYRCDNSGWCNHGKYLFTAINEKNKELIYKSETW